MESLQYVDPLDFQSFIAHLLGLRISNIYFQIAGAPVPCIYEEELGVVLTEDILKATSELIQGVVREDYVAGRYRESVFMILLENETEEEAYAIAEAIRYQVLNHVYPVPRRITVSGGVVTYSQGDTISEFIQKATEKMIAAQRNGGNQTIK